MKYQLKVDGEITKCGQCPLDWRMGLCELADRLFDPHDIEITDLDNMDRPDNCPLQEVE